MLVFMVEDNINQSQPIRDHVRSNLCFIAYNWYFAATPTCLQGIYHFDFNSFHRTLLKDCPFALKVRTTADRQKLCIREITNTHNHELSEVWCTITRNYFWLVKLGAI